MCVCTCSHAQATVCFVGARKQLGGSHFSLLTVCFMGSNSGCQAWPQALVPAKPSSSALDELSTYSNFMGDELSTYSNYMGGFSWFVFLF